MGILNEAKKDLYSLVKDVAAFSAQLDEFKRNEEKVDTVLSDLSERVIRLEEKVGHVRTDLKEDIFNAIENRILKGQLAVINRRLETIEKESPAIKPGEVRKGNKRLLKLPRSNPKRDGSRRS